MLLTRSSPQPSNLKSRARPRRENPCLRLSEGQENPLLQTSGAFLIQVMRPWLLTRRRGGSRTAAFQPISWQSHKYAHSCPSTEPASADRPGRTALLISPKAKSTLYTRFFFSRFLASAWPRKKRKIAQPRRSDFLETEGRRVQDPPHFAL